MATQPVKPYLTLPANHHLIGVSFHHGEAPQPLNDKQYLGGFSAASDISIKARLKVEGRDKLLEILNLAGAKVSLSLSINCPSTRYRATTRCELGDAKLQSLDILVPRGLASQQINVTTKLLLDKPSPRPEKLAARLPGSVLWEDSIRLQLEGTGSTFPTQEHEFRTEEGGELAAWRFDFSGANLRGRASRLRLLINQRNKSGLKQVIDNSGKAGTAEAQRLFKYAVACSLLDFCASRHEEFESANYTFTDKGSLGHHLVTFLSTHIRNGNVALPIQGYLRKYRDDADFREKIRGILQSNIQDETLE